MPRRIRWSSTRVTLDPTSPLITPLDVGAMCQPPVATPERSGARARGVSLRGGERGVLGGGEELLGPLHPGDDALVARAAAQVPRQRRADLRARDVRLLGQELIDGHDEARGAEAALEAVALQEAL